MLRKGFSATFLSVIGPLVFFGIAGCSQDAQPMDYSVLDLAPVSGTVKLDDKPLAGATVVFEAENKQLSQGKTDASGNYTLMFDSNQAGVTPGKKTVRITMGAAAGGDGEAAGGEDEDGNPIEPDAPAKTIPAKYNTNSELEREVKPGGAPQTFDFELESR